MKKNIQTNKKELQKEVKLISELSIGDITLGSSTHNIEALSNLMLQLIRDDVVKEYLDLLKKKKSSGVYFG